MSTTVRKPSQRDALKAADTAIEAWRDFRMKVRLAGPSVLLPIIEDTLITMRQDRKEIGDFYGEPTGLD